MIRPNCLTAALERWHTEGGYVALRTTAEEVANAVAERVAALTLKQFIALK